MLPIRQVCSQSRNKTCLIHFLPPDRLHQVHKQEVGGLSFPWNHRIESSFAFLQDSKVVDSSLKWMDFGASHGPAIFCAAGGAAVWHEIYGDIIRGEEGERKKESP